MELEKKIDTECDRERWKRWEKEREYQIIGFRDFDEKKDKLRKI